MPPPKESSRSVLVRVVLLFIFVSLLTLTSTGAKKSSVTGHLEKLGFHTEPLGLTVIGKFSNPYTFYHEFVDTGQPLLMKGVLKQVDHPGLTNWTDQYLRKHFGSEVVKVEPRKKEDRNIDAIQQSLNYFLSVYKERHVYMIQSLNNGMKDLVLIPETLHCGGFQKVIQDAVMWLGSGKMSSLLHRDSLDNILCLFDGKKDIVLIDKGYKEIVESHGFEQNGGYSRVDPLAVDMDLFPNFRNVVWHEANLEEGDCLFIPQHWYHQVNSHGTRHMSINLWFAHLYWFNLDNCSISESFYKPIEPISTFGFASPNEIYRSNLLKRFKDKGFLTEYRFHELLPNNPTKERSNQFFQSINEFVDPVLSWGELYSFDIDQMLMKFPDLFDLPGEPHDDEEKNLNADKGRGFEDFVFAGKSQEEIGTSPPSANEGMPSHSHADFDDSVPLPDAMSSDDFLLPDDPVGYKMAEDKSDERHGENSFKRDEL